MKSSLKLFLVISGSILFNLVFWQEKIALNAVLFDVFILGAVFFLYPGGVKSQLVRWLLAAHLLTVFAVLFQNTLLSKLAFCTTLLLLAVFTQYVHRSAWYAAASVLMNYLLSPASLATQLIKIRTGRNSLSPIGKRLRFLVIPLFLLLIFFLVYGAANAVFLAMTKEIGRLFNRYILHLIDWISWERSGFFFLGIFITSGLLLKSTVSYFSERDTRKKDDLQRARHNLVVWRKTSWFDLLSVVMGKFATGMLALRNEQTTGLISLLLLNILLLFINCIDIVYVWFGFEDRSRLNLSEYVHEGTGMLIFSILLAMVLLLFLFRGNLNFYSRNKWLRYGAYAWLVQNAVLVISVLFRDYYYIERLGLAYKRIGVLFFLGLVLCGLVTVFIKIHQRKTAYFLLRINAWCVIVMLVASSCVHWDEEIAQYNLARKDKIRVDVKFLLTLSDKTLPLLEKYKQVLDKAPAIKGGEGELLYRSGLSPLQLFELRKEKFKTDQNNLSWLSWNRADAVTKQQLDLQDGVASLRTSRNQKTSKSSPQHPGGGSLGGKGDLFSIRSCIILPVWPTGFMEGY